MRRVIAAEALKLRTTRTFYGVVIGALALIAIIAVGAAAAGTWEPGVEPAQDLLGIATLAQTFALILGILAVSTEFRHGTITPSLLVVPSRARLVAAKLVAHVLAGLLLGIAAFALTVVLMAVVFAIRGIDSGLGAGGVPETVIGGIAACGLYAALGVGLGALVRNQVGAVVGALGWVFVVEPLIGIVPGIADEVGRYGLNGVTEGLGATSFDGTSDLLGQVPAGLLLTAYAAVFVVLGALVLRRRDVSA